jgi:hypothetical protein
MVKKTQSILTIKEVIATHSWQSKKFGFVLHKSKPQMTQRGETSTKNIATEGTETSEKNNLLTTDTYGINSH